MHVDDDLLVWYTVTHWMVRFLGTKGGCSSEWTELGDGDCGTWEVPGKVIP